MGKDNVDVIDVAKDKIVSILIDCGLSLQMNCFTGKFEFVNRQARLDNSIWLAVDKTD